MYIIIELFIFIAWVLFVVFNFFSNGKYLLPLFVGGMSSLILEIVNDFVFSGVGTFYPYSLFYFPLTRFPLAIVLAGSLYAVFFHFISVKIFNYLKTRRNYLKYIIFSILISASIPFELLGQSSGYWVLHNTVSPDKYLFHFSSVYLFYFAATFPCFITAEIIKKKRLKYKHCIYIVP